MTPGVTTRRPRLTADDRRLRAITEAQWQQQVTDLATLHGWSWYAPPRAGIRANGSVRTVTAGWPDLVLVRETRLVFAELKRETGRTTEAQTDWLTRLAIAGAEAYVWRPSDLPFVVAALSRAAT